MSELWSMTRARQPRLGPLPHSEGKCDWATVGEEAAGAFVPTVMPAEVDPLQLLAVHSASFRPDRLISATTQSSGAIPLRPARRSMLHACNR